MAAVAGSETRTTCPYCGVGCGVLVRADGTGGISVRGDPEHPANRGRLCSKGAALAETVGTDHRLLAPRVHGRDADWDTALDAVAERFGEVIANHGPDAVAFYVSGQMLTEDYYVANKLMKGFIGSANIDTNSRLCMASTVAGHKRAFGTDTVPGVYDDLDEADLVVLVGSNLAWCHPVLYQRVIAARESRGTRIVTIDPRRTASCEGALHLPLTSGSDVALFNALLSEIERQGATDVDYVEAHVDGFGDALAAARLSEPSLTGLDPTLLQAFIDLWIGTERVVTVFSQGVNQSSSGSDKVNAIINCHLATGRIGKPGTGPFSVTGQPNAMGGREVGGLANMLACHLDIENPEHRDAVRDFWQAPSLPRQAGLKAVELFEAVGDGRIKALWVIHSNPAVTLPDADRVRDAIATCPFVVVSDVTADTDTARLAEVILPATAWGEKSGTVTNSDRTISRQRAVLPAPGEAKADWWILADVARRLGRRMGWPEAFAWEGPADIFAEHAALSGLAGDFGKDFDIAALARIGTRGYDDLAPVRWPRSGRAPNGMARGGRFFADGGFFHPNGRARMLPLSPRPPADAPSDARPFRLNTGRLRDQWHTMTRTALSPRLSAHLPEPFVDMNPAGRTAPGHRRGGSGAPRQRLGQRRSPRAPDRGRGAGGSVRADALERHERPQRADRCTGGARSSIPSRGSRKARPPPSPPRGSRPPGTDSPSRSPPSRPSATTGPAPARAAATAASWRGGASRRTGSATPARSSDTATPRSQRMSDTRRGRHRLAFFDGDTLLAALYVGPEPVRLMRDFLVGLPGGEAPWALAGRARGDTPDPGPVICSCYAVGRDTIRRAIASENLASVDEIGASLSAGTNCGSCKAELASLIAETRRRDGDSIDGQRLAPVPTDAAPHRSSSEPC